jgi:hypothetical protein
MMASATGSIMRAVAVFEIHMLTSVVASMIPNTMLRPLRPPTNATVTWAMRRWAPQYSAAADSMKPPRNSRMNGSPYAAAAFSAESTPVRGNNTTGTNDVAANGSASETHQQAHSVAVAAVQH